MGNRDELFAKSREMLKLSLLMIRGKHKLPIAIDPDQLEMVALSASMKPHISMFWHISSI